MRKLILTLLALLLVAACAKKAIPEGNIKGVAKFQLSGGAAISQPGTDEYNPYVVKMPDGFLVLVFGSDRSCGSCSGHNLFVSRSTAAYNNDAVFPAFNTPVVFTVGGTPLNMSSQINFAGSASGSNLRIYLTNAGGTIQYADVSPTGSYNVGALTGITNTTWQVATVGGLDAAGTTLYIKKSGALYAVDPAANTPSLTAMVTGGSASSLANVNSTFSGRSDAFFALTNGSVGSMSLYGSGGSPTTLNTTIGKAKVSARNLSVLQTGVRKGDLMFISGVESGSSTQDMYVVDGLNVGDMWDLINPKPPGTPASSSGGASGAGSTWTARTLPSSAFWASVAYGNGVFVAIAGGPSTIAATSPDGITWTSRTLPSSAFWTAVTFGNGVFAAIAAGPSTIAATSPDGITWTSRILPSSSSWGAITYANSTFVAVATNSANGATSPDGITWTARTLSSSSFWRSVTFGNGTFVAISSVGAVAATSPDGITWTPQTLPSSAAWWSTIFGNGLFVAVATTSSTAAPTSPDGITWTPQTLPTASNWNSLTYGNGVFVAVANGPSTAAATSVDGVTWTARTLPSSAFWSSVSYGNGVFVAVAGGPSTIAATSP